MTSPSPTAQAALRTLQNRIDYTRNRIAGSAQDLADTAARYAASIANGEPDTGTANRLAQAALQLADLAGRLEGYTEGLSYLEAVTGETIEG